MPLPFIITKAWLADHLGHSFFWIRKNVLTDQVVTQELKFDLDKFKRWKSFPLRQGNRLKQWLAENDLT